MLGLVFRCVSCEQGARAATFPACATCFESAIGCPPLCSRCGSPACPARGCGRGWAGNDAIDTYSARYLLVEPGYVLLRQWKKSPGPFFDRRILAADPEFWKRLSALGASAVIPVPQRVSRAWRLGGSPALRIARWASSRLGAPVIQALRTESRGGSGSRQAELPLSRRFQNRLVFSAPTWKPGDAPDRVILVDDFMTTGHTLRAAARALKDGGVAEVHAFCLGVRPLRVE